MSHPYEQNVIEMRQLKILKSITSRDSECLEKYLNEIGKVNMLHPDEEVDLAQRIKSGDDEALQKMVCGNLRFVVSVAKQYQNQGLSLSDLINEGNLGLIKAAQKYDETRGFKFISYAVWWIRQSILQALAEQSRIVRLPINQVGALKKLNKGVIRFEQEFERMPTSEEMGLLMDFSKEKIIEMLKISGRHVSFDAPFHDGEENNLLDVVPDTNIVNSDNKVMKESLKYEIDRALSTLSKRERDIVNYSFGLDDSVYSLDDLAEKYELTKERVRQIKDKAIRKLRQSHRSKLLKDFLG